MNYIPISVLPSQSNISEKVLYKQETLFLNKKLYPCLCYFCLKCNKTKFFLFFQKFPIYLKNCLDKSKVASIKFIDIFHSILLFYTITQFYLTCMLMVYIFLKSQGSIKLLFELIPNNKSWHSFYFMIKCYHMSSTKFHTWASSS